MTHNASITSVPPATTPEKKLEQSYIHTVVQVQQAQKC